MKSLRNILPVILFTLLFVPWTTRAETSAKYCQTSPRVTEQIRQLQQAYDTVKSIQNKCPSGIVGYSLQPFLEFTTMTVDFVSFLSGTRSIHADITSSQALYHDTRLYMAELRKLDALVTEATKKCNNDAVHTIKTIKETFYNLHTIGTQFGGYRALISAKQATINGKENYFYQPDINNIGYYADNSIYACTEKEYKFEDISMAFQQLTTSIKNMWVSVKDIKTISKAWKDASTPIKQQGLLSLKQAKETILSRFEDIKKDTFSIHLLEPESKTFLPQKEISDITKGATTMSQEEILSTLNNSRQESDTVITAETRRASFYSLYNSVQGASNAALEESLATTLGLLRGKGKLCSMIQDSANNLVTYCQRVVANKPAICDDTSKQYTCD